MSAGPRAPVRSSGKRTLAIIGNLVVLVLIVAGIWAFHDWTKPDAQKVQVGQCVKVAGTNTDPKVDITDCGSMDANYKVIDRQNSSMATCPQGDYSSVWQFGSGGYKLCLRLNVKQGDCIHKAQDNKTKVSCDSPDANYKVTGILDGTTNTDGCSGDTSNYLSYTKPDAMVICLAPTQ
jgi:hypothetical protein